MEVPTQPGQYMVYDSPHLACVATVRTQAGRIDEGLLHDTLVSKHKLTVAQVQALLDKCRVPDTIVTELQVTLKK